MDCQYFQVRTRGETLGLSLLRSNVQCHTALGWVDESVDRSSGHEKMGQDTGVPRARPQDHPVRGLDCLQRLGAGRWIGGHELDRLDQARRRRDLDLSAHGGDVVRLQRVGAADLRRRCRGARRTSAAPGPRHPAADPPSRGPRHDRSSSHSATISRLPTAWLCSSPALSNRCCSTFAQVRPHSSSRQSAASASRRSPGGSTPSSRRSRPDEPPLSATVTTAVMSSQNVRSARRLAARPWPPPSATTRGDRADRVGDLGPRVVGLARSFATHVSMHDSRLDASLGQPATDLRAIATLRCLPPVQPTARLR